MADDIYSAWGFEANGVFDDNDLRGQLFNAILKNRADLVLAAIRSGADANTVFEPVGENILVPNGVFMHSVPKNLLKQYGLSAVGLAVAFHSPKAIAALIGCGAVIDDAYVVPRITKQGVGGLMIPNFNSDGQGVGYVCIALYNDVVDELKKVKPGWRYTVSLGSVSLGEGGDGYGLLSSRELSDEVSSQRWRPAVCKKNISVKTKSGCFIATRCYGSADAEEVICLREFRDNKILMTKWGHLFVALYYSISPVIADKMAAYPRVVCFVRFFLLDPIVWCIIKSRQH